MKITKALLFAWYFVATDNGLFGSKAITQLGPFDDEQTCQQYAKKIKPGKYGTTEVTECWSVGESPRPSEKEQSK